MHVLRQYAPLSAQLYAYAHRIEAEYGGEPEQVVLLEGVGIELDNVQRVVCESERCVRCVHRRYCFPLPVARRGRNVIRSAY